MTDSNYNSALDSADFRERVDSTDDCSAGAQDFVETASSHAVVVDDECFLRSLVKTLVERVLPNANHSDHPDGEPAFDHLMELAGRDMARVDLVVSDQMMERMHGLELYRKIRAVPSLRTTPFLLMSGGMPVEDMRAVHEHLASDPAMRFLTKPFKMDAFNAVVSELMQTRQGIGTATPEIKILD